MEGKEYQLQLVQMHLGATKRKKKVQNMKIFDGVIYLPCQPEKTICTTR